MIEDELPWRPRSLEMRKLAAAREKRLLARRRHVRARGIEFTEAGPLVTSLRYHREEDR